MNLRNVGDYNIGLDIGTGSVGWIVTDTEGEICHFKGKPTWGSRLFPSAETAADTRVHRGQRRRYDRRRWRLNLLQELFAEEMDRTDSEFFIRLNQSRLHPEDRSETHKEYLYTLFNDSEFDEKAYYEKFPTIYHLRKWLIETEKRADIRLIYLAIHNIVKHRGNFLQHDKINLTSENADIRESVLLFCEELQAYCDELEIPCSALENSDQIITALSDTKSARSQIQEKVIPLLGIGTCALLEKPNEAKAMAKALSAAMVGLSADTTKMFFLLDDVPEGLTTKIYLSNDEHVMAFEEACPDIGRALFESLKMVYSSFVLQEILSSAPGKTLSANKVADYVKYAEDLKMLKALVKEYVPEKYDVFFRGEFYTPSELHPQKYIYDKSKAQGYTKYNEVRGWAYDEFKKAVEKLFKDTPATDDPRYQSMMERFKNEKFLRRLKTSDNGAIPFQLHREELNKIIENQGSHYPFLKNMQTELDSLVTFRIPYYVGPLTDKNAARDKQGKKRFSWAQRIEGAENEKILPWNWSKIIDKDRSATEFIQRMTGTCTYILGEPVLPKSSLLYEEYCVLNELNGAHFTLDGDREYRFDYVDRSDMVKELFRKGKVTYKKVAAWMAQRNMPIRRVLGGQGENGFESKLGSYIFFAKDIFNVDEIPESDYPMIEEIILWSTIFEDRDILKEKLKRKYGSRLTDDQIKKIVRKRFTGWGRLSKKFLCDIKVPTDNGAHSIMDILREGNPNHSNPSKAMVLMEILHDDKLGFANKIDELNKLNMTNAAGLDLNELPGSPALRRGIGQALGIVREIVYIVGHEPTNIFLEVTREDDVRKKGKRTQKRIDNLKIALQTLKTESPEFWSAEVASQLKSINELDEKLTLYFMQGGKSLYSGQPLDIGRLSEYQVDHIIPRSYIKDDSLENKALVLASENQNKSDQMLLPAKMRHEMRPYWDALHIAKLIGDKKYNNLLRDHISEKSMKGFIARQLVETSQIVKTVRAFLDEQYENTNVLPVKAGLSHELRERIDLPKCREINDFHHAHDALLAAEIGRFTLKRHEGMYLNPIGHTKVMKNFIKQESAAYRKGKSLGGSSFIISSFLTSGFDEETGELFKDDWSASYEIAKLKTYFNYKQCFISRMPEETSGQFWVQTIYSPRGGKKTPSVPLKKRLSVERYGGYAGVEFAYFVLLEVSDQKGRIKRLLEGMPISEAHKIKRGEMNFASWADDFCDHRNFTLKKILRRRILKYTRLDQENNEFYIAALDCVYNARELATNLEDYIILAKICDTKKVSNDEISTQSLIQAYSLLVEKSIAICTRFKPVYEVLKRHEADFVGLPKNDQRKLIQNLLNFFKGTTTRVDLSLIGGPKNAGGITNGFISDVNSKLCFVDQSITGMFERRTRIGL